MLLLDNSISTFRERSYANTPLCPKFLLTQSSRDKIFISIFYSSRYKELGCNKIKHTSYLILFIYIIFKEGGALSYNR